MSHGNEENMEFLKIKHANVIPAWKKPSEYNIEQRGREVQEEINADNKL